MTNQGDKLSPKDAVESLTECRNREQKSDKQLKIENKLIIIASTGYGLSIVSFGYSGRFGIDSVYSILALLGFCMFLGVVGVMAKKYDAIGMIQSRLPGSFLGLLKTIIYGAFYCALYLGSYYFNMQGITLAPVLSGLIAAVVMGFCMYKYPTLH